MLTVAIVAVSAGVAPSSLADATGAIAGTVTEAAGPHAPIAGIRVCAFNRAETSGPEGELPCAITGAGGEYTIAGLPGGQYNVEFWVPPNSHLNYVGQYYDDKPYESSADAVTVTAPTTTSGIDARLAVGGQISGTVTDASSGAGLEGVLVCADLSEGESGNCALSGAGGAYTVPGLASGNYKVFFFGGKYQLQLYDGKTNPAEASLVAVVQGETKSGIDAALQPSTSIVAPPPGVHGPGSASGPSEVSLPGAKPYAAAGHERAVALRLYGRYRSMFVPRRKHPPVSLRLGLRVEGGNTIVESVLVG